MDATLEVALDSEFLAAAEAAERDPSDIVASLMREFVERERNGYTAFLQRKVDKARQSYLEGRWHSNEEVTAEFAARKARLRAGDDASS